jgi:hypothetical protein
MIDEKIIKTLAKVYAHSDDDQAYDAKKEVVSYRLPARLSDKERTLLQASGYQVNAITQYSHDSAITELKNLAAQTQENTVLNLFLHAVGRGYARGLQAIVSYYFAKHVPQHSYVPIEENGLVYSDASRPCKICGLPKSDWRNDGKHLYDLYIGWVRVGASYDFLLDLAELPKFNQLKATQNDIAVFKAMIACIKTAGEKDTASDVLSVLSKQKVLPGSNNTSRIWLLRILAELGVLPNKFDANHSLINQLTPYSQILAWELQLHNESAQRAEINFPISAWRGRLGVNEKIVAQLLAKFEAAI